MSFDATTGYPDDFEDALGQMGRIDLRKREKSESIIAELEVKTTAQAYTRQQGFFHTYPRVNQQRCFNEKCPQGARGPTEA